MEIVKVTTPGKNNRQIVINTAHIVYVAIDDADETFIQLTDDRHVTVVESIAEIMGQINPSLQ